jgi:hypothetical protein
MQFLLQKIDTIARASRRPANLMPSMILLGSTVSVDIHRLVPESYDDTRLPRTRCIEVFLIQREGGVKEKGTPDLSFCKFLDKLNELCDDLT